MKPFTISIAALALFVGIFFVSNQKNISRATYLGHYRTMFHVEQKVSDDGILALTPIKINGSRTPTLIVLNHNRSLRAYVIRSNTGSVDQIIIESARPRNLYVLTGPFQVVKNKTKIDWASPTVLRVSTVSNDGDDRAYLINVQTLSYSSQPIPGKYTEQVFHGGPSVD